MAKQRKGKKGRADGRKCCTFTFEGKRYYAYGSTLLEASEKANRKLEELKRKQEEEEQKKAEGKNPVLQDYFDEWTEGRAGKVKENTIRKQCYQLRSISEAVLESCSGRFGDIRVKDIKKLHVVELQSVLREKYSTNGTNGIIALLFHVMEDAIAEEIIAGNPARYVKPLMRVETPARETVHRALSDEECRLFFEAAKDSWYLNLYSFLIASGCRIGEAGALMISDIRGGFVNISRTLTYDRSGAVIIGRDAKTRSSKRSIPYTDLLRKPIERQREINRALFGEVIDINGNGETIFRAEKGKLLHAAKVNDDITKICKKAGIEKFSAHAFRDTFATNAIRAGMKPATLKGILGHQSYAMTMDLYYHLPDETKIAEMEAMKIAY